jgi:hypothetical protein
MSYFTFPTKLNEMYSTQEMHLFLEKLSFKQVLVPVPVFPFNFMI